ncbi:MAG: hypothetical protein IIW36_04550 [Clostridia bacterium]|nr:hypothetical protein [Clostridia bacterium]
MKRPPSSIGTRLAKLCISAALLLFVAILVGLSVLSLSATTDMHTENPPREGVLYLRDHPLLNLGVLFLSVLLLFLLWTRLKRLSWEAVCTAAVLALTVLGFLWVSAVQGVPMQDSAIVTRAAYHLTLGDASFVTTDYFLRCPYQLGFVLFCEILLRLFPTGGSFLLLQYANVLCLSLTYVAILRCMRLTFARERDGVMKLAAILLLLFLPPVFFCTFAYGVLPALLFSCLAMWQFLALDRTETKKKRILHLILCALFLGIAVCLKKNSLIVLCAILIIGVLRTLREKDLTVPLCLLLCLLCSLGFPKAVQWQYELRTGFSFGQGVPMQAWTAMGLHDSYIAPGWYESKYVVQDFYTANKNPEAMKPLLEEAIRDRLQVFSKDPAYAVAFFSEKIASQWNEPTYQGIWLAEVRQHYGNGMHPIAEWVCGEGEDRVTQYLNYVQQLLLPLAAVGAFLLLRERRARDILFPTVFLGGFLYHLLFEAKSQYCMIYMLLLIPIAALGAEPLLQGIARGMQCLKRKKT